MTHDAPHWSVSSRARALHYAVGRALRAPSVHNTQPWHFVVDQDAVTVRADRSRQLPSLDPSGRELVMSVGAALLNLRVGLAVRSWATEVRRLPDPDDPDLVAVVRAVPGRPETELADLDNAIARRRTNRRRYSTEPVPDDLIARLSVAAAAEGAQLVPVRSAEQRRIVARLTATAAREQDADPSYRAELLGWTGRPESAGDGVPSASVPRTDGLARAGVPLRDLDPAGRGGLPADTGGRHETLILLTTRADDEASWLRAGEALERVLLRLTQSGYVGQPVTQAVEVPVTRSQLRAALSWDAHPQMLLRIGRAAATPAVPRRSRARVVEGTPDLPAETGPRVGPEPPARSAAPPRPVPDGRGGTTWL
jgi:hypothetical protein